MSERGVSQEEVNDPECCTNYRFRCLLPLTVARLEAKARGWPMPEDTKEAEAMWRRIAVENARAKIAAGKFQELQARTNKEIMDERS